MRMTGSADRPGRQGRWMALRAGLRRCSGRIGGTRALRGMRSGSWRPGGARAAAGAPAEAGAAAQAEELPRWDLEHHFGYSSLLDTSLDSELAHAEHDAAAFKQTYESKLGERLVDALKEYERLCSMLERVGTYANLKADVATNDDSVNKRKTQLTQRTSVIEANSLSWFAVELASLDEGSVQSQLDAASGAHERFGAFVKSTRKYRPHTLSKEIERALSVRSAYTGKEPVVQHMMREISYLSFPSPDNDDNDDTGENVNLETLLSKLNQSRSQQYRSKVMRILNDGLGTIKRDYALSLNVVAGDWKVEMEERKYPALRSKRNLENDVSDETVDALIHSTKTTGAAQAKRYYAFKKKLLQATEGISELWWSDRNAPVPIGNSENDSWSWNKATDTVERSFNSFSGTFGEVFSRLVRERRIDVPAAEGKKNGAFCAPLASTGPSREQPIGPFELLNFTGNSSDVATLAHESGHAVHFALCQKQGPLQFMPSLPLAETASIYGEEVTFREMVSQLEPEDKLAKIVEKIDAVVNSTVRQVHFDQTEAQLHEVRAQGEITADDITRAFHSTMHEMYGGEDSPFDDLESNTGNLLNYVPHLLAVPFYVYSYSFSQLLVARLYLKSLEMDSKEFETKLLDLLKSGGTKELKEALAPFGLDPTDPAFWDASFKQYLGSLLDEAESLAASLGYVKQQVGE